MPEIKIYSTPVSPYCDRAKRLLDDKGQSYNVIDVSDPAERMKMIEIAGGMRTVPQIFIGETHVGGFDDLAALDRRGELDELLAE